MKQIVFWPAFSREYFAFTEDSFLQPKKITKTEAYVHEQILEDVCDLEHCPQIQTQVAHIL